MQIGLAVDPSRTPPGPASIRPTGGGNGPIPGGAAGTARVGHHIVGVITTSTRRFMARPEAVALVVIGSFIPRPE